MVYIANCDQNNITTLLTWLHQHCYSNITCHHVCEYNTDLVQLMLLLVILTALYNVCQELIYITTGYNVQGLNWS